MKKNVFKIDFNVLACTCIWLVCEWDFNCFKCLKISKLYPSETQVVI